MEPNRYRIPLAAVLILASLFHLNAQNGVDAGLYMSGKGLGLSVDIFGKSTTEFTSVSVFSDMHGVVTGKHDSPGIRANLIRNFIFNDSCLDGGGKCLFYGGPGITAGYSRDNGKDFGPVVALSGHLGVSFMFEKISFSIGMTADLGLHLLTNNNLNSNKLTFYKDGIFHALVPEVRLCVPLVNRLINNGLSVNSRPSRFVFSVEQGILSTVYEKYDNTYINSDGSRNSYKGINWSSHINSLMLISLGYAVSDCFILRMSTGYAGLHKSARDIPLTFGALYAPRSVFSSGMNFFADAGAGFGGSSSRSRDFVSRIGCGRRFAMGNGGKSIDLNFSAVVAYYRPDCITSRYSGEIISGDDILDSGSWILGPMLTFTFNI